MGRWVKERCAVLFVLFKVQKRDEKDKNSWEQGRVKSLSLLFLKHTLERDGNAK